MVSRRRFPWKATSPNSLIVGSEGIAFIPLSQNVGKSACCRVSTITIGASFAARLLISLLIPSAGSRTCTATIPCEFSAAQRVGSSRSRLLFRIVVNSYFVVGPAGAFWASAYDSTSSTPHIPNSTLRNMLVSLWTIGVFLPPRPTYRDRLATALLNHGQWIETSSPATAFCRCGPAGKCN